MIPAEREARILDLLQTQGSVTIEELSSRFAVSEMTARRDLDRLEEKGLAERRHGGAMLPSRLIGEESYVAKVTTHVEEKHRIASAAIKFVRDHDTLILDSGSTTHKLLTVLNQRDGLSIVTNDLVIALDASRAGITTHMAGGLIQAEIGSAVGEGARAFFERLIADVAFIGISSISHDGFLCTTSLEKAAVKAAMMKAAHKTVLLVDASKFGTAAFVKICPLTELDVIVTDHKFPESEYAALTQSGITIVEV